MTERQKLPIGYKLRNRYEIIEEKGCGAFGITYLAKDLELPNNHRCIVKHLQPKSSDPQVIQIATRLFQQEAEHLYRLGKHDRIPCLNARFEEEQEEQERQFYLVEEYIEGHNLSCEIGNDKLWDEETIIKNLKEILEILKFVHQNNIIHRDIKPDNIIRRNDGKLVLIDFGAVKEITNTIINSEGQTILTVCIGPFYMPIEQHRGRPVFASDIYAVGVIGILGITGSTTTEKWRDNCKVEIGDKLAAILDKMTHEKHEERYQDADKALDAINKIIENQDHDPPISEIEIIGQDTDYNGGKKKSTLWHKGLNILRFIFVE